MNTYIIRYKEKKYHPEPVYIYEIEAEDIQSAIRLFYEYWFEIDPLAELIVVAIYDCAFYFQIFDLGEEW